MREFDFIKAISKKKSVFFNPVIKGIGDDCAILPFNNTHDMIITADSLCEGVHFKKNYFSPVQIGAKSMAVNVSDICAMGGIPKYAVICIGFPGKTRDKYIEMLYAGISDFAENYGIDIIGGDTIASPWINITITVIGLVEKSMALRRDGAEAGDNIFVTGFLGDSHAGLKVLTKKGNKKLKDYEYLPVKKHLAVSPRFFEGRALLQSGLVNSCIDISDGIISDITRMCDESGTGAIIHADKLPVSYSSFKIGMDNHEDAADYALYGGEDYELLFTVAEKNTDKFMKFAAKNCVNAVHAGVITGKKGVYIKKDAKTYREDGTKIWSHF